MVSGFVARINFQFMNSVKSARPPLEFQRIVVDLITRCLLGARGTSALQTLLMQIEVFEFILMHVNWFQVSSTYAIIVRYNIHHVELLSGITIFQQVCVSRCSDIC